MDRRFLAHVLKNPDGSWNEPQYLSEHLVNVAAKCAQFASAFENGDWGELVGLSHDLGKYHPSWQTYLRQKTGYWEGENVREPQESINHSTPGAISVTKAFQKSSASRLVAYMIAGHHAGLPDWYPDEAGGDLEGRLFDASAELIEEDFDTISKIDEARQFISLPIPTSLPVVFTSGINQQSIEQLHLWVRMLFSCLVDADYLDTEQYMDSNKFSMRGGYFSIPQLKSRFDTYMAGKRSTSSINIKRNDILSQCRTKAANPPGFFSLNVPTGGGKTLSSMAFALEHAIRYKKERIIVAIPYTSIIEQTAKVFKYGTDDEVEIEQRKASNTYLFGEEQVVEHHSNLDSERESDQNRLASENWDAPIIVTTNVQLFDSLFAARPSSCRKLHNIANSVIIIDEAQMLPPGYLKPLLSVLTGLVKHFGVTVVLMSATQPALEGTIGYSNCTIEGLTDVTQIIDDPQSLSEAFKRVDVRFPANTDDRSDWEDIAIALMKYDQVLCIVNRRSDCRMLHALMPDGTIHLSAAMCGEERSYVISNIKRSLREGEAIRVVSTQLVEAGVDIDFPVVFRTMAGMDSIAQAAGRCNRENKLAENGRLGNVIVFNPPTQAPRGSLRKGEDACKAVLRAHKMKAELSPAVFLEYFQSLYSSLNGFDEPGFAEKMIRNASDFSFQFRTFAQKFSLIDSAQQRSIIIWYENPYNKHSSKDIIERLRYAGPSREVSRKLQRFAVNVPEALFNRFQALGFIEEVQGFWVQTVPQLYKPGWGIILDERELNIVTVV